MNRVAKNASWIIICKIVQSFCSLIIGSLTARYLGPANYGLIAYASSLASFMTPVVFLGFGNILVRELIDCPEKEGESLGTAMRLSSFSASICIAVIIVFASAANKGERETIIVCALLRIPILK